MMNRDCLLYGLLALCVGFLLAQYKRPSREPFESLTKCLKQGYPRDFCLQVPAQAML